MSDLDLIVKEFLIESYESLEQMENELVILEKDPTNQNSLDNIFRIIHNIKGSSGILGFLKLEELVHIGENLLSQLRDRLLVLNFDITNSLLTMVDAIRKILANIEATGEEGEHDHTKLIEFLISLSSVKTKEPLSTVQEISNNQTLELPTSVISENNVRVDVKLLDQLMDLVGELVLVRNQIIQFSNEKSNSLTNVSQRLNLITTELQERIMKTRMQPIGNIWNKFPRLVRDLAAISNKQIDIEMEGKQTELDRTIIEAIKDPLTHLVRNAVDHGIEEPIKRISSGKPAIGRILLKAFHENGQVNIEISDDGTGLDPNSIKQKALENALITSSQIAGMDERELINLIFLPGLSTAEGVTHLSGRGVGMDVVKTNIEKIGGTIDIRSNLGQGTKFTIRIPLTLAIIPALIATSGNERYAIPQVNLLELVRFEGKNQCIETIYNAPVYRLRGELLPLIYLNQELMVTDKYRTNTTNIIVLQAGEKQFGLVVDEINDTEEIVVKPLGKKLKSLPIFAGATIMGDGRVALIMDVLGLARRTKVVAEEQEQTFAEKEVTTQELDKRDTLLLFRVGEKEQMAIPLSTAARLEEFPCCDIEKLGNTDVVQYRGQIMSLVYLSEILDISAVQNNEQDSVQVIVYSDEEKDVGLVVDSILDIIEQKIDIQHCANRQGILGSAVVQQVATNLLDIPEIIRIANPISFVETQIKERV